MQNKQFAKFVFTLIFIIFPALVGFWLFLPDWDNKQQELWLYYVGALGFIIYSLLIGYITVYFKYFSYGIFAVFFPLSIALSFIFISFNWHIALRITSVIFAVLISIPTNILIRKFA